MLQIQLLIMGQDYKISLKEFNSFAVDVAARRFILFQSDSQLSEVLDSIEQSERYLVIGGGSNILFVNDFPGVVVANDLKGKQIIDDSTDHITVKVAGGENWNDFVRWTIENSYFGLENLSLIPGTVGAAPVQNIGAYGVELDQYFDSLEAIDLSDGKQVVFTKADCQFGYRDSIFKRQLDRYLITSVNFRLSKCLEPVLNYAGIKEKLVQLGADVKKPTGLEISNAICQLRNSKLPLPAKIGNAGSFFKNPTVLNNDYVLLKSKLADIPAYKTFENQYKISAAWLIEQCGWKGYRQENVGVYPDHALVLVNYGGGTGKQLWQLADQIKTSVTDNFGIELEPEPRIIH